MDLPIKNGDNFRSDVSLPEGTKITQTLWATMSQRHPKASKGIQRLCHCQPTWRSTQWAHVFLTLKEHRLILHAIWRFNLLRLSGFIVQECRSKSPRWRAGRMGVQNMTNINQRNADATCCLLLATQHKVSNLFRQGSLHWLTSPFEEWCVEAPTSPYVLHQCDDALWSWVQ